MALIKLRVADIIYGPSETVILVFETTERQWNSEHLVYKAGQFLTLVFDIRGRELRRSYSLCSSPDAGEPLAIAIKRVENGEISRMLHHHTRVGDELMAMEPNGLFVYEPNDSLQRTVFLFGAGVGITPLFSILKTALLRESHSKIVLVYSNRSPADTLFYDELNRLQQRHPERLKVIYAFSQSQNLLTARLNVSMVQKVVGEEDFQKEDALFYTCGPLDYMNTCSITLLNLGFDRKQIKRETFVLPEDEADDDDMTEKAVKDTNTYSVVLDFDGKQHELQVPYNKTILNAALEKGIRLPYSCKSGLCSTCTATCIRGGVRMDYNQVLMDDEIAAGRVLVCTAHPTENGTNIVW
jgi:ring-1,2-phenylacetyl-CoA epoxidase subunit PaaE